MHRLQAVFFGGGVSVSVSTSRQARLADATVAAYALTVLGWIAIGVGGGAALTAYAASTAAMVHLATIGLGLLTGGFAVLVLNEMVKDAEDRRSPEAADNYGSTNATMNPS